MLAVFCYRKHGQICRQTRKWSVSVQSVRVFCQYQNLTFRYMAVFILLAHHFLMLVPCKSCIMISNTALGHIAEVVPTGIVMSVNQDITHSSGLIEGHVRWYSFHSHASLVNFDILGHDLSSYATALIDSGLARLPPADHPILCQQQASFQGSVHRHLELLKVGQAVFPELLQHPDIRSNAKPTLFHPDLHKRNIFISKDDPTIVTGIIDWQCASVEPAFYYADDVPDFAKVPAEGTSESDEETLCSQAYEVGWALLAPRLGATRKIDETLLRPFRYCHRTWRDGFVPFTHELIRLRDAWKELGFEKDCPIPPLSPEEMSFYKEQLSIYDGLLEFRQDMVETLGVEGDGWVSEDRWEGVKKAHQHIYENIMAAMENDKDREELRTMWPFDQCQPRNGPDSFHRRSWILPVL